MNAIKHGCWAALAMAVMLSGCKEPNERRWADKAVEDHTPRTATPAVAAAPVASATPTVTPAVEQPAKPKAQTDRFRIERVVLASGVKNRTPIGESTTFELGAERVYAFLEVENPDRAEGSVFVSFVPPKGAAHGPIELQVGAAPRWRTWAYTRAATRPGTWKAVVKNAAGKVLAESEFQVGPSDAPEARPAAPSA